MNYAQSSIGSVVYVCHLLALTLCVVGCGGQDCPGNTVPSRASAVPDHYPEEPAAIVNGKTITYGQLQNASHIEITRVEQQMEKQIDGLQRKHLKELIDEQLLAARAQQQGISTEALVQSEVEKRIQQVDDDTLFQIYEDTNEKYQGRLPPYEEIKEELRAELRREMEAEAQQQFLTSLRADAEIKVFLSPFLPAPLKVPTDGPSKGNPEAPVIIVQFADFQCPFCVQAQATIKRIMHVYGDKVRVVFRDLPLPMHPMALKAAEAAHCAGDQGKYWQMNEWIFENYDSLSVQHLKDRAHELGLDTSRFDACLDTSAMAYRIEKSKTLAKQLGLRATPAFFINGRLLEGAQPFSRFQEMIDAELSGIY